MIKICIMRCAMTKYPSQLQDKFNLRLPDGMRDVIAERAKRNGRSMNSEIVDIISNAVSQPALAQEGIEYLLGLANPGELEKLSPSEEASEESSLGCWLLWRRDWNQKARI
jgi:plasmid stability protein